MKDLMISLRNRLESFLSHKTTVTSAYVANTSPAVISVDDISGFNIGFAMRNFPQATIYFFDSVASKDIRVRTKIKEVDRDNKLVTFENPINVDIPIGAYIKRTPNWTEVKGFYLGDPASIPATKLPAICVSPSNKEIKWMTLTGTTEKQTFNIYVHVLDDNQDNSTITLTRITEDVVELLNADLHMKIEGRDIEGNNRPYNSLVTSIQYGHSSKGQFCKSSQISWFGDEYWGRLYVVNQDLQDFDSFE